MIIHSFYLYLKHSNTTFDHFSINETLFNTIYDAGIVHIATFEEMKMLSSKRSINCDKIIVIHMK